MTEYSAVSFGIVGGNCTLTFEPGYGTGREEDSNPGVSFRLTSDQPTKFLRGQYYHGMGVIRRSDAKKLADALTAFLAEHPAP